MRAVVIAAMLLAVASTGSATTPTHEHLFADFKTRYNKKYDTPAEDERRFAIFSGNMRRAAAAGEQNPLATFGASKFADLTKEEFSRRNGWRVNSARHEQQQRLVAAKAASEVTPDCTYIDWRLMNAVTPVKDQSLCGACWAFSATGNMEGQWALAGHKLVSLSEQELISCDTNDDGCLSGEMDWAWDYMLTHTGGKITEASLYPFQADMGLNIRCKSDFRRFEVGAAIVGWRNLPSSEPHMAQFVCSGGPLSVAVDSEGLEFYTGGIITSCPRDDIDHAVLIVGMNLGYSTPYWIIKNSWGVDWGEEGFGRVEYGKDLCSLAYAPMTAIVK